MEYPGNCRDLGRPTGEIQARLPAQLDSPFRWRPNYTIPSELSSLPGRKLSLVLTALLFAASGAAQAKIINAPSPSLADVSNAIATASDGDTVIVPTGTASWTSTLNITKGITLIGQTTITGTPPNLTANDLTIIQDNTPRTGGSPLIKITLTPTQSFRLTGFTFKPGIATTFSGANGAIALNGGSSTPTMKVRLDHCHFASIYQGKLITTGGWTYGVVDHNLVECVNQSFLAEVYLGSYGGSSQANGNGSWSDYPWYGTDKFWFFEDNMIIGGGGGPVSGTIDSAYGGRFVARHNYFRNATPSTHGTEGGAARGVRCMEFYDNTTEWTIPASSSGQRSGGSLWHDNTYIGNKNPTNSHTNLGNFRETPARSESVWGIADGTSIWDQNDTEGNGTYVEAHASSPYVFASGTVAASPAPTTVGATGTIYVSGSPGWTSGQWIGYSIKETNSSSSSYPLGSYITNNGSNWISYFYYSANDTPKHLVFAAGDTYAIHRVLRMTDQNGGGKADLVADTDQNPYNTVTNSPFWPHQAIEPCFSWNNVHTPTNTTLGYKVNTGQPTTVSGTDYFNLGAGFPADSTPSQVSSRYVAALNGVDYNGPFTYPHPLVSGVPTAPTNLRVVN